MSFCNLYCKKNSAEHVFMQENLDFCVKNYEHQPPQCYSYEKIQVRMIRLIFISFMLISSVYGHGEMHDVIKVKNEEITKDPQNASLYLQRGLLYEQHGAADEAVKDFNHAEKLKPELTDFNLLRGKVLLANDQFKEALENLNRSLQKNSTKTNSPAYALRGRAFYSLKKYDEAEKDFIKAVDFSEDLRPALVLELMHAHLKSTGAKRKTALSYLEKGLERVGPSIALLSERIFLLEEEKDYLNAAEEAGKVLEMVNRKEIWLIRRAEYLIKAGKKDAAEKDLNLCLELIKKLPEIVRSRKINKKMRLKAEELLESIR